MNKTISIIGLGILFIGICVDASSAAIMNTIEMPNVEDGDFIWGTINVDTPGQIFINGWTNNSYDDVEVYLYDQTGKMVANKKGYSGSASLDYTASDAGTYTVKVNFFSAGKIRTLSASSNYKLSLMPKSNKITNNVAEGNAVLYGLKVNKGEMVFINGWTNNSYDDVEVYLYDQTGKMVANKKGYSGSASLDYTASDAGTYTVKVNFFSAGKIRTLSVSSNHILEDSIPAYIPTVQTPTISVVQTSTISTAQTPTISSPITSTPIESSTSSALVTPFSSRKDGRELPQLMGVILIIVGLLSTILTTIKRDIILEVGITERSLKYVGGTGVVLIIIGVYVLLKSFELL